MTPDLIRLAWGLLAIGTVARIVVAILVDLRRRRGQRP